MPRRALIVVLATALALPAVPAAATPAAPAAQPVVPSTSEQRTVTLLTGDVVQVLPGADGRIQTRYVPADPASPGAETRTIGKDVYVVPDAAAEAVASGRVDQALFNVSGLLRQGYDDAGVTAIPVITTYDATAARAVAAEPVPAGTTRTRALPSVGAVALKADKAKARDTWRALTSETDPAGRHVRKVWLDARVRSTLDESVPYVRAPQAWQAGYDGTGATVAVLDSGVDAEHPDLAGTVIAEQNFSDSPDVRDHDGHGTHVSSTVLGRGTASAGRNKGVAPGAKLLSGKVLNDYGSGSLSGIVAGMEWAVAEGADVVSMSIGTSEPADCTDPMAEALNRLSSSSDALFVVAAGNLGGPAEMLGSPGCASAALTVAATDLTGATADFSGRGPVLGSHAVKPDIAAPGVGITAARAGGRGDSAYTDKNGTSMATPHVAGAAAILAQQHPDWDGERLKAVLQSAVRSGSTTEVYEQGAGELDVAAAVGSTLSGPGTVDLGTFAWPHTPDETVTKQLGYTNSGPAAETLRFTVDARGDDGKPLPATAFKLGASRLTVPAGGVASLPVTVTPSASLGYGVYGAISIRIVATSNNGRTLVTPVGFYLEPKHVDVTFRVLDRNGKPASGFYTSLDVFDLDSIAAQRLTFDGGDRTLHLRAGAYSLAATVGTLDAAGKLESLAFLGDPERTIDRDTTITFDARQTIRSTVRTDRPAELRGGSLTYGRVVDGWVLSTNRTFRSDLKGIYLAPTPKARRGTFEVVEAWQLGSPTGAKKPYLYTLAFTHSKQVRPVPVHRVQDRQLASIDAIYHTPGKSYGYSTYTDVYRPWSLTLISTGDRAVVAAPTQIEHLVTAERDTRIGQMVGHSDAMMYTFSTYLASTPKAYRPGSQQRETWYAAGIRPGLFRNAFTGELNAPAQRSGNEIWTSLSTWTDTQPGHYGWFGFLDLGGTELIADGESLGRYGFRGQGSWDVPAQATDFELVYELLRWQRGNYSWLSPTNAETRWRFRSEAGGPAKLPLLFPDYDLAVDGNDRAARVAAYPISIGVESGPWYTPGAITNARAWASYDDGSTWTEVPVRPDAGRQLATVDNTKAAPDGFVSLRVQLTDANGVAVTQTTTKLYAVQ